MKASQILVGISLLIPVNLTHEDIAPLSASWQNVFIV
jgi:hypothetical protein